MTQLSFETSSWAGKARQQVKVLASKNSSSDEFDFQDPQGTLPQIVPWYLFAHISLGM